MELCPVWSSHPYSHDASVHCSYLIKRRDYIFIRCRLYTYSIYTIRCVWVSVRVPGRCPTVWLCSVAATPSSRGCSSSGKQTGGTPPRSAACGGAQSLSKNNSHGLKNTFQTHSGRLQLKAAWSLNNNRVRNKCVILSRFLFLLITAVVAATNVPHVPSPHYRDVITGLSEPSEESYTAHRVDSRQRVRDWRSHVMFLCFNVRKRAKKKKKNTSKALL